MFAAILDAETRNYFVGLLLLLSVVLLWTLSSFITSVCPPGRVCHARRRVVMLTRV